MTSPENFKLPWIFALVPMAALQACVMMPYDGQVLRSASGTVVGGGVASAGQEVKICAYDWASRRWRYLTSDVAQQQSDGTPVYSAWAPTQEPSLWRDAGSGRVQARLRAYVAGRPNACDGDTLRSVSRSEQQCFSSGMRTSRGTSRAEIYRDCTAERERGPNVNVYAPDPFIEVMTFNTLYRHCWLSWTDGPRTSRAERGAAMIVRRGVDIVGLQEPIEASTHRGVTVFFDDLQKLSGDDFDFHDGNVIVNGKPWISNAHRNAIFWRRSRFEHLASGGEWLPAGAQQRGAAWVELRERGTGTRFVVYNVHLDHRRNREAQSERLRARIVANGHHELPLIVLGDLNATITSAPLTTLTTAARVDGQRFAGLSPANDPSSHTYHGFLGPDYPNKKPAIDFVLHSHDIAVARAEVVSEQDTGIGENCDGRAINGYYSDHYPVQARLMLP